MIAQLIALLSERREELLSKTLEHLLLTGVSTLVAVLVGVPLAIWLARNARFKAIGMSLVGILQTIPSLALLAFLLPFVGIGVTPALIALTLYALLPIVRNTLAGLEAVPAANREAALAMGFTQRQQLFWVELPLALPTIVAGIRTAVVIGVGIATLATFIGAGGLGDFISRGLAVNSPPLILLGAIPAALLAISLDYLIHCFERLLSRRRSLFGSSSLTKQNSSQSAVKGRRKAVLAVAAIAIMALLMIALTKPQGPVTASDAEPVRIGSKNFTEQFVLGEIMAQLIEANTPHPVERKFNLGSITICHQALLANEIDIYPEYSGTAFRVILNREEQLSDQAVYREVRDAYRQQFDLQWLAPFGFNNTYAIAVREAFAQQHQISSIDDLQALAPQLNIGFLSEFYERPDGYAGLIKAYDLSFKRVVEMDLSLLYQAVRDGKLDVLSGNSTDGRLAAYNLRVLKDTKQYFPPYFAAPVVRGEWARRYPTVAAELNRLAGVLNEESMQALNYQVDELKQSPAQVAREFLVREALLNE